MVGFALFLGHLVGDYIFQNDWMAANKSNPGPGPEPWGQAGLNPYDYTSGTEEERTKPGAAYREWLAANYQYGVGHWACTIHCVCYTAAIALFSFWWMPWWGYLICFLAHWPIDRFRVAKIWMVKVAGQEKFATGLLSPWSIILVDQIFHLLTLYAIALAAGAK